MSKAATDEQRAALERVLEAGTEVGPLDALADVTELVALLAGWRWQVVAAAREQGQLGADHHCD